MQRLYNKIKTTDGKQTLFYIFESFYKYELSLTRRCISKTII